MLIWERIIQQGNWAGRRGAPQSLCQNEFALQIAKGFSLHAVHEPRSSVQAEQVKDALWAFWEICNWKEVFFGNPAQEEVGWLEATEKRIWVWLRVSPARGINCFVKSPQQWHFLVPVGLWRARGLLSVQLFGGWKMDPLENLTFLFSFGEHTAFFPPRTTWHQFYQESLKNTLSLCFFIFYFFFN